MGPANSRRIPRAPRYSGYCYQITYLLVQGYHLLWLDFPNKFQFIYYSDIAVLLPLCRLNNIGLGCSAFARHYLRNHILFSLPAGTKMFQFPAFAHLKRDVLSLQLSGLPHSEISGSQVVCTYPKLIAAYHVLHRLLEPRHPPFALIRFSLIYKHE